MSPLPLVPGLYRSPNGYLTRSMGRITSATIAEARPGTAPGGFRPKAMTLSASQPVLGGVRGGVTTVSSEGLSLRGTASTTTLLRPATAGATRGIGVAGVLQQTAAGNGVKPRIPEYVTQEKQVLRFYAYFTESAQDSSGGGGISGGSGGFNDGIRSTGAGAGAAGADGGVRVRRFSILYYLADGTISIEEPKTANSGFEQGKFMKRARAEKPRGAGGGCYGPADFAVGAEPWILGRRFCVVDADVHTREYFTRELGRTLGRRQSYPDEPAPTLPGQRSHVGTAGVAAGAAGAGAAGAAAGEVAGGAWASRGTLHARGSQMPPREKGEFYRKDRKVLRFYCKYEDDRLLGDTRDYILYYYLLNDTLEIKEIAAEGRWNFRNLLRRQKLPKDSMHVPTGYGGVISPRDPQKERVESVTWKDLRCGEAVNVYGRHMLLLSCDASTAEWYAAKGVTQRTLTVGHGEVENAVDHKVAPYNGYGNEDDLFAMGLSLEPMNKEVNQEEYERFLKGDKKVLRFQAHLKHDPASQQEGHGSIDASRDFVVNYFLADDTVSVFEPPVRNSGVVGGLFLARGRYKKYIPARGQEKEGTRMSEKMTMDGGLLESTIGLGGQLSRWLRPTDFLPGSVVTFEMPQSGSKLFTLTVLGLDEYTRKLLQETDSFPQSAVQLAVTRIAEVFSSAKLPMRSIFRARDPGLTGALSENSFRAVMAQLEATAAAAPSAKAGMAPLTQQEMCEIVTEYADPGARSDRGAQVLYDDFVDALVAAGPRSVKLKDRTRVLRVEDRVLKAMAADFETRAAGGRLRAAFRAKDARRSGYVTQSDWIQVLRETKLNAVMTRQVAEALCLGHDTRGNGLLDYNSLCDDVFPGDFDHFAVGDGGGAESGDEVDVIAAGNCGGGGELGRSASSGSSDWAAAPVSTVGARGAEATDRSAGNGGRGVPPLRRASSLDPAATVLSWGELKVPESPVRRQRHQPPPTVGTYLRDMNQQVYTQHGDLDKQLGRAMTAFSSCFARTGRRKLLRKHFLAFDIHNIGKVNREHFLETVDEVAAEVRVDFDQRDRILLADFFFVKEHGQVDYETLLEILFARDVLRAHAFRKRTLENASDYEELFTAVDNAARKRDFGGTLNLFAAK